MPDLIKPLPYVKQLLTDKPHLRDDNDKLVANYWNKELIQIGINPKSINGFDVLQRYANGSLTKADSITRVSRKLQEEFPELRGKKWEERQKHQGDVKKQLYETPEFYQGGTP